MGFHKIRFNMACVILPIVSAFSKVWFKMKVKGLKIQVWIPVNRLVEASWNPCTSNVPVVYKVCPKADKVGLRICFNTASIKHDKT